MNSLRLLLIRHGATNANVTNVLDSRPPGLPLSLEGRVQAAALAEKLSTAQIVGVYASLATRAQQTADAIAERHGLAVRVLKGVHEVQLGSWEGRRDLPTLNRYIETFTQWIEGDLDLRVPNGETGREVLSRYLCDVEMIRSEHTTGVVALVSHGAAIRLASLWLADNLDAGLVGANFIPNVGYIVLETVPSTSRSWRCLEWIGTSLV